MKLMASNGVGIVFCVKWNNPTANSSAELPHSGEHLESAIESHYTVLQSYFNRKTRAAATIAIEA